MFNFLNRYLLGKRLQKFGIKNANSFNLGGMVDLYENVGIGSEKVLNILITCFSKTNKDQK